MNTYGRIELGGRGKLLLAGPFVLIAILAGIGLLAADPDNGLRPSPAPATAVAEVFFVHGGTRGVDSFSGTSTIVW